MTTALYYQNAYQKEALTKVTALLQEPDGWAFSTDQSPFYPRGGGQPGDRGSWSGKGQSGTIVDTFSRDNAIWHLVSDEGSPPEKGGEVVLKLDWERRYKHMRLHSAMHLLCSLVHEPVTGGGLSHERARLDFSLPASPDKSDLTQKLQSLVAADFPISPGEISESELDANPELVRALSVKPPRGTGKIRVIRVGPEEAPVDFQPCGGTHVKSTSEIGPVAVVKIENKGRQNRRISLAFQE